MKRSSSNSKNHSYEVNRILRVTSPVMSRPNQVSAHGSRPTTVKAKKVPENNNFLNDSQVEFKYRTSLKYSDMHLNAINQLKHEFKEKPLFYNCNYPILNQNCPIIIYQIKNSNAYFKQEPFLPLPPIEHKAKSQMMTEKQRLRKNHSTNSIVTSSPFASATSTLSYHSRRNSKQKSTNFVSNYLFKNRFLTNSRELLGSSTSSLVLGHSIQNPSINKTSSSIKQKDHKNVYFHHNNEIKNEKNQKSVEKVDSGLDNYFDKAIESSNYLDEVGEAEADNYADFENDDYYDLKSNLSGVDQEKDDEDDVDEDDDDQQVDNLDDDDDDDDDEDGPKLKQKSSTTSSEIYSSLSSASLIESDTNEDNVATDKLDNEEDFVNEAISMSDILSKYGYDFKSLLTETVMRKQDKSYVVQPPLTLSLFANVPPTIKFVTQEEKLGEMPESLKKLCKWKMCAITPNIVKATIARSNFKLATGKHDWIGVWGSHMKPEGFRSIREYQKMNHLPGSFQIGRKDRLCRNLYHAQAMFGKSEYNFVPVTFVLPQDYGLLKQEIESKNSKWIIKPPASARGQGIRVVNKIEQIPKKRPCVVQKYLSNPYLIDGLKFDLRIYVYVTSYDPLRIYLFNDGLTRFASRKYSNSSKTIGDKFMHLTNYSINKTNKEYKSNDDENACVGHKWSLKALWVYLQKKGINTDKIWDNIKDLVIKTIICGDPHVNILVKTHLKRKYSTHELFGFDVILDENLKPWIVEVNISPSLHSSSPLDVSVKGQMIADLFNLAGYMIPDPREIAKQEGKKSYKKIPKILVFNRTVLPQQLSNDEKTKHHYFIQRNSDEKVMSTIMDKLTPDDIRMLIETEDEYNRRGNFSRIFPNSSSKKYLKLFETTRYYNLLLNEWICKFKNNRDKAISILNNFCKKKIHFQNPSKQPENCWSPTLEAK